MHKIFVGGLNYQTTEDSLDTEFSRYGEVTEIKIIKDFETNRSRGFGFITFADEESMNNAIEKNGIEFEGRTLKINKAEEKKRPVRAY